VEIFPADALRDIDEEVTDSDTSGRMNRERGGGRVNLVGFET
jgi:hypothetical protein